MAAEGRLRSIDVQTLPYPGIATDYKPLVITMLSVADDVGIVTENLYPGRFRYVEELIRLGADIRTNGHHAVVRGVPRLSGAPVKAHDIRAGAAMVVAGLAAEGETVISGVGHIDRGYDDLVGRLAASAPTSGASDGSLAPRLRSLSCLAAAGAASTGPGRFACVACSTSPGRTVRPDLTCGLRPGAEAVATCRTARGRRPRPMRRLGPGHPAASERQETGDDHDRADDEEDLVPPALVGEEGGRNAGDDPGVDHTCNVPTCPA